MKMPLGSARNALVAVLFASWGSSALELEELPIDASCQVTVLNRTVQADASGRFIMPNVPSFMGKIKARAACVRDGVVVSGETAYFEVPDNGAADTGHFYTSGGEKTLKALSLENGSRIVLEDVESAADIYVIEEYLDGSRARGGEYFRGYNYASSNPSVVTVSEDGVLEAVGPGRALLTVRKDGVTAPGYGRRRTRRSGASRA